MLENKEKTFTYLVIISIVVALLIVIITIWIPSSTVKDITIRNYEPKNYGEIRLNYYKDNIFNILSASNFEKTYQKIDEEYLKDNNLNDIQEAKDYFMSNSFIGNSIVIESIEIISKNNDNYVYRVSYNISDTKKYAFISEKKINDYTISFSNSGTTKNLASNITKKYGELEFLVTIKESRIDSIVYEITIKNNYSDIRADFNLTDLYSVQASLEDNSLYNMASIISNGEETFSLNPNSFFTKEYVFNIPQEMQGKINGIKFNDIQFTTGIADVFIPF